MIIKDEIFTVLRQNYDLRKLIADKFNTREVNVYRWADRKSQNKVGNILVIKIIKKELKLSYKDIFENKIKDVSLIN
jgi:hypothetical protein